jgi:hypothetical protein
MVGLWAYAFPQIVMAHQKAMAEYEARDIR